MLSPSRLNDFLGCEHRTWLDLLAERGELARPDDGRPDDGRPADDRLRERGLEHEARVLDGHREQGRRVVEIAPGGSFAERAAATEAALRDGADVIYQGCLLHDGCVGFPDFLVRVAEPRSAFGSFSYEVHDAKLTWWKRCADRRRADDHVTLAATVNRTQAIRLEAAGVNTVGALAQLPAGAPVPKLSQETLTGMRLQAALQLESRRLPRPRHVLLAPEHGHGLHRLPRPSGGDLFFDFEGDPWWGDESLEYLFGTVHRNDGEWRYDARWATTRAGEKATFEASGVIRLRPCRRRRGRDGRPGQRHRRGARIVRQ